MQNLQKLKKSRKNGNGVGEINCLLQKNQTNENLLNFCCCQPINEEGDFENDEADFWKQN